MASTGIDLTLFYIVSLILTRFNLKQSAVIFLATLVARVCSSLFNYKMNKKHVFGHANSFSMIKYYILCVCQMTISASVVYILSHLLLAHTFASTVIKAITDSCLFFISFRIQKNWVFKRESSKKGINTGAMRAVMKSAKYK